VSGKIKMKCAKFRFFICRFVLICPKPVATNPSGWRGFEEAFDRPLEFFEFFFR